MLLQFFFTTCVTSKKLLQKTRRNNPRSGFPGFRYPLITVELPAIRNCQQSPSNASRPSNPSRKKNVRQLPSLCFHNLISFQRSFHSLKLTSHRSDFYSCLRAKKKSGSYCWQLTLPSESVKIAVAILPLGTQPHFPAVLISIPVFAQKKSLAATYFPTARAVSSALESLTSVFGMGTGIASPLWPPDIMQNSRFELLTPTMST